MRAMLVGHDACLSFAALNFLRSRTTFAHVGKGVRSFYFYLENGENHLCLCLEASKGVVRDTQLVGSSDIERVDSLEIEAPLATTYK